jgi:hypothetical protein
MKLAIVISFTLAVMATPAFAQSTQYVPGYLRADGTYVQGYYRTVPDSNPYNNYSTRGNVNPYTGQPGYRSPYQAPNPHPAPNIMGIQSYIQQGFEQGQQERLRQLEIQRLQQQLQNGNGGG